MYLVGDIRQPAKAYQLLFRIHLLRDQGASEGNGFRKLPPAGYTAQVFPQIPRGKSSWVGDGFTWVRIPSKVFHIIQKRHAVTGLFGPRNAKKARNSGLFRTCIIFGK